MKDRRTLSAYHEAGHTVMAVACGVRVKGVTIATKRLDSNRVSTGYTQMPQKYKKSDTAAFLADIISALAGPLAESVFLRG